MDQRKGGGGGGRSVMNRGLHTSALQRRGVHSTWDEAILTLCFLCHNVDLPGLEELTLQ